MVDMVRYRHTQIGTVILGVAAAVSIVAAGLMVGIGFWPAPIIIFLMGLLVLFFYALTVEVDEETLLIRLGIGLIRRRIPLEQIDSARPVRHRWFYGFGIRFTPRGWIWIVSGLDAVELSLSNGKRFQVGTDEPRELIEALAATGNIGASG